jgi:Tol biopolymer transport system component
MRRLTAVSLPTLIAAGLIGPAATTHAGVALNGRIAYVSYPGDMILGYEVFATNLDGSGATNLSNAPQSDDNPAWSADGTKIAFRAQRDGNDEIYVMNTDGSGQTNLTNTAANDEEDPAWSPDGTRIAFDGDASPINYDVFVMNADGTGRTNLTNSAGGDYSPTWSPDGTKVAFTSDRTGNKEIFVMNADGSAQTNLTQAPAAEDSYPAWSPDGSRIAFQSNRGGDLEIYVMNADGSGQVNLSNTAGTDDRPAWSPDGTKIAFSSERTGDYEIFVMNADGSGQINVTNHPEYDADPTWQPVPVTPSVSKARPKEGKPAKFRLTLPDPPLGPVTYEYRTKKGSARPGKDFKKARGSVTFSPGDSTETIKVKTRDDGRDEINETFFLVVTYPGGAKERGRARIKDDD